MGTILNKVVRPDMVWSLGTKADARSVGEPESASLGLFGGNFQPLAPPDALDPFVVDDPPGRRSQKLGDLPIAVAAILAGEFNDIGGQPLFVLSPPWDAALRRTVLSEHAAEAALGHLQFGSNMIDTGMAARGAQKFPFAASARIILSSVRSETARRSRAFSASSSFIRFT
jgi:hypothetical protein